jgi:dihydrofolate reductase/thymidylate synthase
MLTCGFFGTCCKEAMASPLCKAIHHTEVEADDDSGTYVPAVDTDIFRIWAASIRVVENGLRFSFVTYVRSENLTKKWV